MNGLMNGSDDRGKRWELNFSIIQEGVFDSVYRENLTLQPMILIPAESLSTSPDLVHILLWICCVCIVGESMYICMAYLRRKYSSYIRFIYAVFTAYT